MKTAKTQREKTLYMVELAVLISILLILNFTPLGLLKINVVAITFFSIPVIIGAVVLGPWAGAFLGLIFGILSLLQAPTDSFFGIAFAQQPLAVAAICIIPRMLIGITSAYSARYIKKYNEYVSYFAAGLIGSLTNTVLFIGSTMILLYKILTPVINESGKSFVAFWIGIGIVNGIPEAVANTIICGAVIMALKKIRL